MEPAVVPIVIQAPEKPPRYKLTAEERDIIERVVTAEAVGEPFAGQVAVAQCILNACEKDGTGRSKFSRSTSTPRAGPILKERYRRPWLPYSMTAGM